MIFERFVTLVEGARTWHARRLLQKNNAKVVASRFVQLGNGSRIEIAVPKRKGFKREKVVWVHAASIGEGLAVSGIVRKLFEQFPRRFEVVMTCSSSTALQVVPEAFSDADLEFITFGLVPLDLKRDREAFFEDWMPNAGIFVESELWPGLLSSARRHKVKMLLVNARISPRAFSRWQLLPISRRVFREMLKTFQGIVASSNESAKRIEMILFKEIPVEDLKAVSPCISRNSWLPKCLKDNISERSWVAGSTHEGEEAIVANVHSFLVESGIPNLITFTAPRHVDRIPKIWNELEVIVSNTSTRMIRFSQLHSLENLQGPWLIVVDTLGDLAKLYSLVDIAFVGGSLLKGKERFAHNVFEPRKCGCRRVLQGERTGKVPSFVTQVKSDHKEIASIVRHDLIDKDVVGSPETEFLPCEFEESTTWKMIQAVLETETH